MLRLILIRHGQTAWNAQKKIMGRTDVPLDETGQKQIHACAHSLKDYPIDRILSSPQLRALETSQPLAKSKALPIEIDPRLSELKFKRWVGKVLDEIKDDPVYKERRRNPYMSPQPDIETLQECMQRTKSLLDELSKLDGCIACVSHMDPLTALISHICDLPLEGFFEVEVKNASPRMFVFDQDQWREEVI